MQSNSLIFCYPALHSLYKIFYCKSPKAGDLLLRANALVTTRPEEVDAW